jgi:hypothetical protein
MNPVLANLLVRLYPRVWRARYGAEFETFLRSGRGDLRASADVVWSASREHLFPTRTQDRDQHTPAFVTVTRQPSAFLPLTMSFTALALVLLHLAIYGVVRETDEGAVAHLWQLLMAGQMPIVVFFVIRWLPRAPRQALAVLALQAGAGLASMAPVFFLNL